MFEHHTHPLLSRQRYLVRLAMSCLAGLCVIGLSLGGGMTGDHVLEGLSWLDSFLNASMLLSGMGPLMSPLTDGGKLFAGAVCALQRVRGDPRHRLGLRAGGPSHAAPLPSGTAAPHASHASTTTGRGRRTARGSDMNRVPI